MVKLNSALLAQLNQHGVTINEGIAVDERLIRSASKPVSTEKLNEPRDKQNSIEGNMDKNAKPRKFSDDLKSD